MSRLLMYMALQADTAVKKEVFIPSKKRHHKEQRIAPRRTHLKSCTVDDEVFCIGDSAYALEEGQTYRVRRYSPVITVPQPLSASLHAHGFHAMQPECSTCLRLPCTV